MARKWMLVVAFVGVVALIFLFNIPSREVSARFISYETNSSGGIRAVFVVSDPKLSCNIGQISRGSPTGWVTLPTPTSVDFIRPHGTHLSFSVPDTSDPVQVVFDLRRKRLKDRCEDWLQWRIEGQRVERFSGSAFRLTNDLPSRR